MKLDEKSERIAVNLKITGSSQQRVLLPIINLEIKCMEWHENNRKIAYCS